MSFQGILACFFTFTPPGPDFIFRIMQQGRWGGGNTLQRRIRCRFGSNFTPPDLSKTLNANPLFLFLSETLPWWITSHNHNIFRDHFSNVCYGTSIGESSRCRDKI
jgi:hypothetical protein